MFSINGLAPPQQISNRDSTFGFEFGTDKLSNRAYVSEIAKGSSAEKICSSWKATRNQIRGAYFVSIDKEKVFTREDVVRVLKRLFTEQVKEFEVEFAPERRLSASQMRKSLIEHSQVLFNPEADMDQDHVPQLTINYIRSIAKHLHPDTDCSEDMHECCAISSHD